MPLDLGIEPVETTTDATNISQRPQSGDYVGVFRGNTFKRLPLYMAMEPFNVRRFGAAVDGVTDDTDAFQDAVTTCAASEGGKYDIVIDGICNVGGPVIDDPANGFNNCQIGIPPATFGSTDLCHITIRGSSRPTWVSGGAIADVWHSMKGPLIVSTRTTATGVMPCVIGGSNTPGQFNYNFLTVKNLGILLWAGAPGTPAAPVIGGINGFNLASVIVEDCLISINRSAYTSLDPGDQVSGVIMPRVSSESMSTAYRVLVNGLYHAFILGEHAVAQNAQAFNSMNGFTILPSYHAIKMRDCLASWVAYPVVLPTGGFLGQAAGPTPLNCDHLQVEIRTGPVWNATQDIFTDTGNHLTGSAFYSLSSSGSGTDVSTTYASVKNGARNLQAGPLNTKRFEITDATQRPTLPVRGMSHYNVATGLNETYNGTSWI